MYDKRYMYVFKKDNDTRRPRCSRILLAKVRKASSIFMFSLQDTSKKGMSKLSAIFCPLSASTALFVVTSHLFAATTFTTSGEAFFKEKKNKEFLFNRNSIIYAFISLFL